MSRAICLILVAMLAACGPAPQSSTDANTVDPAITAALADPIMADPELDARANRDVLRPPDEPLRAMVPPGEPDPLRANQPPTVLARALPVLAATPGLATCDTAVRYSYGWAAALSADVPLPPEAQVAEAAGSNAKGCALRLVAWSAPLAPDTVLAGYRRAGREADYTLAETSVAQTVVLTATRRDGAAFVITVGASDGGSKVDFVTNRGR